MSRRYYESCDNDPVAVISGFHMMKKGDYTQEEAQIVLDTAKQLCGMDTVFYTGHCTGDKALALMAPIMGEKLVQIHSGMVFYTKVKNGDTEPKFQIGALSLSQKEWNKFLEEYDEIQDIIREMMREEQEKREAERLQKEILEETAGSGMTKWEPVIG